MNYCGVKYLKKKKKKEQIPNLNVLLNPYMLPLSVRQLIFVVTKKVVISNTPLIILCKNKPYYHFFFL